jgi:hypothetical protein
MKTFLKTLSLLAAVCGLSFAQSNSLTLTTLTNALTANGLSNTVVVGTAPTLPLPFEIYVDREAMLVKGQSSTTLSVVRGYNGTAVAPHAASAVVFTGQLSWFTTGEVYGNCTASAVFASPILNVYTGKFYVCNSNSMYGEANLSNPLAPMFTRTATAVSYTAKDTDNIIGVTSTAAARTITLPTPVGRAGKVFIVKDESNAAGTNNITVVGAAGNIDAAANKVISANAGALRIYSDGANYFTF